MTDPADQAAAATGDNLFGRPLFDDPSARALSRVGVAPPARLPISTMKR